MHSTSSHEHGNGRSTGTSGWNEDSGNVRRARRLETHQCILLLVLCMTISKIYVHSDARNNAQCMHAWICQGPPAAASSIASRIFAFLCLQSMQSIFLALDILFLFPTFASHGSCLYMRIVSRRSTRVTTSCQNVLQRHRAQHTLAIFHQIL